MSALIDPEILKNIVDLGAMLDAGRKEELLKSLFAPPAVAPVAPEVSPPPVAPTGSALRPPNAPSLPTKTPLLSGSGNLRGAALLMAGVVLGVLLVSSVPILFEWNKPAKQQMALPTRSSIKPATRWNKPPKQRIAPKTAAVSAPTPIVVALPLKSSVPVVPPRPIVQIQKARRTSAGRVRSARKTRRLLVVASAPRAQRKPTEASRVRRLTRRAIRRPPITVDTPLIAVWDRPSPAHAARARDAAPRSAPKVRARVERPALPAPAPEPRQASGQSTDPFDREPGRPLF